MLLRNAFCARRASTFTNTLTFGSHIVSHPGKPRGGEDALFFSEKASAFGVADGVGGWVEAGVDAGIVSRDVMRHCHALAEAALRGTEAAEHAKNARNAENARNAKNAENAENAGNADAAVRPLSLLRGALKRLSDGTLGTTTAVVAAMDADVGVLRAAWVGDSSLMVVRSTAGQPHVIFRTAEQQHSFNFPFQIGPAGCAADSVDVAEECEIDVTDGDLVIVGSDGLFDNLFDDEIVEIVDAHVEDEAGGVELDRLARVLCEKAQERATTPIVRDGQLVQTPYEVSAMARGVELDMVGGKLDDVAVVAAKVSRITQ